MSGERPRCQRIKEGGERCKHPAMAQSAYCWSHSPGAAEQRKQIAAAGGRAGSRRSPDELERIKAQVRGVAASVLTGEIDRGTAGTLGMLFNVLLRGIELQRRLDHQQELEEQVADLRERLDAIKRGRYGTA